MDYKILVPSGIGDFSWLWSKLVTTKHNFHIEYIGGYPDRLDAFLRLLPADRILSFRSNADYATKWTEAGELICYSKYPHRVPAVRKSFRLSDLSETEFTFFECNSFLEAGNRLENWLIDEIPETDFHYDIEGKAAGVPRAESFIVNFSSYGTKKAWGYYEVPDAAALVALIASKTRWVPIFIGGEYDDFTRDVFEYYRSIMPHCVSLIGRTGDLKKVVNLLQESRLYFGACSGLMVLSNNFYTPVIAYYPKFEKPPGKKLAGVWHDAATPHLGLFWDGALQDISTIKDFLNQMEVEVS